MGATRMVSHLRVSVSHWLFFKKIQKSTTKGTNSFDCSAVAGLKVWNKHRLTGCELTFNGPDTTGEPPPPTLEHFIISTQTVISPYCWRQWLSGGTGRLSIPSQMFYARRRAEGQSSPTSGDQTTPGSKSYRRPRPSPGASQTYWSVWLAACRSAALIKALAGPDKTPQCLLSNLGHAKDTD